VRRPAAAPAIVALAIGVLLVAAPVRARAASPSVDVPGSASTISVDAASGESEDATVVVHGAQGTLSVALAAGAPAVLQQGLSVLRLETTTVDGRQIADPLPPLARQATVSGAAAVPLVLRLRVPDGTPAARYAGQLVFSQDGRAFATRPIELRVFGVQLQARDDPNGFRTLFLVNAQLYVDAVVRRTHAHVASTDFRILDSLYRFLSDYRISPGAWEYGTPWPDGYHDRGTSTGAAASRMVAEGSNPFSTMRLPLGTQHSPPARSGQSARHPETWTSYLQAQVLPFWQAHGWQNRALVWGWDEPGPVYDKQFVEPQACASHAAGVQYLTTGAPSRRIPARRVSIPWGAGTRAFTIAAHGVDNGELWDDQGCDDVDIWAVLSRRLYGSFATPVEHKAHIDVEHELGAAIATAKARGAAIWSFTYESSSSAGSPGYAATEPATDARVFGLWNALEGIDGTLYADGMTTYGTTDPYLSLAQHGQHVLLYPALRSTDEPVPSLRLENLRDGIEDADLARLLVARRGRAALLAILAREHVFSIRHGRVLLACTMGCDLKGPTKYAWPRFRHDAGTRAALERVHRELLEALAPAPG
jgi:hypothetical protein